MGASREYGDWGVIMSVAEGMIETDAVFISVLLEVGATSVRVGKGDVVAVIESGTVSVFGIRMVVSVAIDVAVDPKGDDAFAMAVRVWIELVLIRLEGGFSELFVFSKAKNNDIATAIPARINPAQSRRLSMLILPGSSI